MSPAGGPGSSWAQGFPANTPGGRSIMSMVYDPHDDIVLMFGGWSGEFNGTTWAAAAAGSAVAGVAVTAPRARARDRGGPDG